MQKAQHLTYADPATDKTRIPVPNQTMITTFKKIIDILDSYERRRGLVVLLIVLALGFVEAIGVASVIPFMAVVGEPELVHTNRYLSALFEALGFASTEQFLIFLGFAVFIVLVGSLSFSAFAHWAMFRFTRMCNYRLSSKLLTTYLQKPYVWYLRQHSADLGRTVLSEVNQVVSNAILPAMNLLSRLAVTLFLVALVVMVDPIVAASAAVVLGGLYAIIFFAVRRYLVWIGTDMYNANEERYRIAQDAFGGIKEIKVSGLERAYVERYRDPAKRFARRQAAHKTISQIPKFLLEAVAFGGMVGIILVLLIAREGGVGAALPLIAVYAFAGYRLLPALQQVYQNSTTLKFGTRALRRLHDELTQDTTVPTLAAHDKQAIDPIVLERELALVDVSFSYTEAADALDRVSLVIPAKSSVAFVGTTGAGKTTIVDIILGLLEPHHGQLLVDGQEISDTNRRAWQRSVGYVPQHIFLVDDTVAVNIAFGQPRDEIDYAAVERAARTANLHDFICQNMAEGYDTVIGERGVRLSGGQRQRIGIARALYRDPSLLVLDEATSALDNVTERAVMEAIQRVGREKTIIMIAHRLSTVQACDQIFLLEKGHLIARGTYDELTTNSSQFRMMAQGTTTS
jgi:ATP-binding cassette, subfamily B, bacterial PglK